MPAPLAAVFDLDGTLVDNMRFHGQAWVEMARRLGSEATREQFERTWAGKKSDEVFTLVLRRTPSAEEVARLEAEKEEAYRTLYRPHLAPIAGLVPFLDRLQGAGIRVAVATAAPRGNRDFVLDGLGLRARFAAVAGPEDAPRGKPAPDLFLAAAAKLGVDPARCVAFEDAANGVRAAVAAGMAAVGMLTGEDGDVLRGAGARWLAPDYASLPAELTGWILGG
jgi:beta-phosphoglucomutase family hydrolase